MAPEELTRFWEQVQELVPIEERQIKHLVTVMQQNNADPLQAQAEFLRFFDFIANESTPSKQWSEKIWDLFDRLK